MESVDKIAHTPGKWEVKEDYSISAQAIITPGEQVKKCTVCDKELESKEYMIEPFDKSEKCSFKSISRSTELALRTRFFNQ